MSCECQKKVKNYRGTTDGAGNIKVVLNNPFFIIGAVYIDNADVPTTLDRCVTVLSGLNAWELFSEDQFSLPAGAIVMPSDWIDPIYYNQVQGGGKSITVDKANQPIMFLYYDLPKYSG